MPKRRITLATLYDQMQQIATQMATQMVTKNDHSQLFAKVDHLSARQDDVSAKLGALSDWVRNGFQDMNTQLKDLNNRVDTLHGLMENLLVRVERLEQEYVMITAGLKRLEERFDQLEANRLRERIEALEKRVTALESVEN